MYLDLNIYLEIVENVVANAVRFANRKISAELYSNKNQLYVIICDDGPGFKQQEAKQQSHIIMGEVWKKHIMEWDCI